MPYWIVLASSVMAVFLMIPACSSDGDQNGTVAPSETVTTPFVPDGPGRIAPQVQGTYVAGGSSSSLGHSLEYRFDFGDSITPWSAATNLSYAWSADGRFFRRAQARCADHSEVMSAWSLAHVVIVAAYFLIDFETPVLGADTTRVLSYSHGPSGVLFTSVSLAHVGLVKNRSTTACVEPADDNQKLGTCHVATEDVGRWTYDIIAQFVPSIPAGAKIRVEFQILAGKEITLSFLGSQQSVKKVGDPPGGTCGYPGVDRARSVVEITALGERAGARIAGAPYVFVIDNFEIIMPDP
jgi:hypothetical protein